MKYCKHCGKAAMDDAIFCSHCGSALMGKKRGENQDVNCSSKKETTMRCVRPISGNRAVAKRMMILVTVLAAFCIIPLLWCLPMTIYYCQKIKERKPVGVGFKICVLLFITRLGGILMLCDREEYL